MVAALAAGLPVLVPIAESFPSISAANLGWLASLFAFLGLFWLLTSAWCTHMRKLTASLLLGAVAIAGLLLVWLGQTAFGGVYAVLVAPLVFQVLPPIPSVAFLFGQTIALGLAFWRGGFSLADALLLLVVFGSLEFFALHSARVAFRERAARAELETANADLLTARNLLAESVRVNERLFVARELHDLLGHHLTALNLALEAAAHSKGSLVEEHVGQARVLVKRLFLELRRAVSTLRDESPLELESALQQLAASVNKPKVHVVVRGDLALESPSRARAVLRCAQEVATNALRHSGANNLWLEFDRDSGGLRLRGRDDGRGVDKPESQHGLRGMKERVEELGGDVNWSSAIGEGFTVDVRIPVRQDEP